MLFVPCRDHCYFRYGKQYNPEECDTTCDYAKVCLENKELKRILEVVLIRHHSRHCGYCKSFPICAIGHCNNYENYELDLEKVKTDYGIEI